MGYNYDAKSCIFVAMLNQIVKDWLSAELQKVNSLVIYINPAVAGVKAPLQLTSKPSFTLLLSHHGDRPLIFREHDLKSDFLLDSGFETCIVPWNAIWAAHAEGDSNNIVFWNENSPGSGWDKALREFLMSETQTSVPQSTAPLTSISLATGTQKIGPAPNKPVKKSKKSNRPHLKLVK